MDGRRFEGRATKKRGDEDVWNVDAREGDAREP